MIMIWHELCISFNLEGHVTVVIGLISDLDQERVVFAIFIFDRLRVCVLFCSINSTKSTIINTVAIGALT